MLTLALDTSSTSGSIALVKDSVPLSEKSVAHVGTHADWLMPNLAEVLAGVDLCEIDLFAAAYGPGSFTGLRIGISTLKGLAWALGKGVAGVSTLKALAMNIESAGVVVCPVLDARKKEVYAALYTVTDGAPVAVMPDAALAPAALVEKIAALRAEGRLSRPVVFTGPGLEVYGEYLVKAVEGSKAAPEPLWRVQAVNVAALAASEGVVTSPALFAPVYLRKSEAELKAGSKKLGPTGPHC